MRRFVLVPLAALLATAALVAPPANSATEQPPPASTAPVLAPLTAAPVDPAAVQRIVDKRLKVTGRATVSAIVVDAASGSVVAAVEPDRLLAPASTTKLLTALGALRDLGAATTFATQLRQVGDHLVLVGGGDPSLVARTPKSWRGKPPGVPQPASLADLATRAAAVVPHGTAWVLDVARDRKSGESVAPTWTRGYVTGGYVQPVASIALDAGKGRGYTASPARSAQRALVTALTDAGLAVSVGEVVDTPEGAPVVAQIDSTPVMGLVERMLTTSNNTYAEYLARHVVGFEADHTLQESAQAVSDAAARAGADVTAIELRDASGLSASDRVTARALVSALSAAARGDGDSWLVLSGLPIAGVSGTLADRYPAGGRGYVRAKTGTLHGVVSLAGTVATDDGNVLLFAFIANGVASVPAAQHTLDATASALAACGCS